MRTVTCTLVLGAAALAATHAVASPDARPRCFGAAARDPARPCSNPRLRLSVVPSPAEARGRLNSPCTFIERTGLIDVCAFGVEPARATSTIALIGDSHASHWRAALEVAARAKRWRGLSITQGSCPLSKAVRFLEGPKYGQCIRWKPQVYRWLRRHPEVRTVVVSQLTGGRIVTRRRDRFAAEVDGFLAAWRALPRSVRRVVVIRDTPKARKATAACIERAMVARRPAGRACASPRRVALDRDPAAVAAKRLRGRVRVVDLTRFFCDRRRCYPVVGGALVFKDITHMTAVFATTLGPYLLRRLPPSVRTGSVDTSCASCAGSAADPETA